MRIAVLGANGHTGQEVVKQALAGGHEVTAIVRRPDVLAMRHADLTVATADVLVPDRLTEALAGTDAVISTLGVGTSRAPTSVYSEGIANSLGAMETGSIQTLVAISAVPAGPRDELPFLDRRIAMPILDRFFGTSYVDMRRMEATLHESQLDWIVLRPPRLLKKEATGHYRLDATRPLSRMKSITYGDLATALLDSLERKDLYRRIAYVAN